MRNILYVLLLLAAAPAARGQGCVAIRSNGSACAMPGAHTAAEARNWVVALNSRYFKSYKHFVGTEEQKERVERGTEVINHFFSTEIGLTRNFNARWSGALFVPLISNARSSMYEHYGNASTSANARRSTHSFGLGDVRLAAYYWLLDPAAMRKGNIQLGLGLKLPTGDYRYTDYFYRNDSTKVLGPVDQSIQLGDGGTGITVEANSYLSLSRKTSLYLNGFYLANPREQNGVSTARGGTPSATALAYGSDVMSVPDQYMLRAGASFNSGGFTFSGGARLECVPAEDLVGGSNGFRRPGYVLSAEPVVAWKVKRIQLYVSVPVAIERNRTQSVPDKLRTTKTGVYAQGDAAFADYTINAGIAIALK
jgi:hypothetical protein